MVSEAITTSMVAYKLEISLLSLTMGSSGGATSPNFNERACLG